MTKEMSFCRIHDHQRFVFATCSSSKKKNWKIGNMTVDQTALEATKGQKIQNDAAM